MLKVHRITKEEYNKYSFVEKVCIRFIQGVSMCIVGSSYLYSKLESKLICKK